MHNSVDFSFFLFKEREKGKKISFYYSLLVFFCAFFPYDFNGFSAHEPFIQISCLIISCIYAQFNRLLILYVQRKRKREKISFYYSLLVFFVPFFPMILMDFLLMNHLFKSLV